MAYNDVPLPTDLISDSQPKIRENFQLLESAQVVDEGSTADGDYIRYENGWQICFIGEINAVFVDSNNCEVDWTFPVSFIDTKYYLNFIITTLGQVPANTRGNTLLDINGDNRLTTGSTLRIYDSSGSFSSGESIELTAFAIGRWK